MIPAPPPPPPPPPEQSLTCQTNKENRSSSKKAHPLVSGAEPELHSALMDELREFAKAPRKREMSRNVNKQDLQKQNDSKKTQEKTRQEVQLKVAVDRIQREKNSVKNIPRHLASSHLINPILSSTKISEELKQSCTNIMALSKVGSCDEQKLSEKDCLLERLKELFDLEEQKVRQKLKAYKDALIKLQKSQIDDLSDVELRHAEELVELSETHQKEFKILEKEYLQEADRLKQKLHLLQNKSRNISAPVESLLSSVVSPSSSRPLSVASSSLSQSTIIDDISEDIKCCSCHFICYPPAQIFQCSEGDILCEKCQSKILECPDCGVSLEGRISRNKVLEKMANSYYGPK